MKHEDLEIYSLYHRSYILILIVMLTPEYKITETCKVYFVLLTTYKSSKYLFTLT